MNPAWHIKSEYVKSQWWELREPDGTRVLTVLQEADGGFLGLVHRRRPDRWEPGFFTAYRRAALPDLLAAISSRIQAEVPALPWLIGRDAVPAGFVGSIFSCVPATDRYVNGDDFRRQRNAPMVALGLRVVRIIA